MDGDQSAGRLYGLSVPTFYLAAHSHQQRAGEPKPQIRRRTRVVGIFPNTESALRLITAVVEEIHEEWLIGKQYLSLVVQPLENPISGSQITEKQLLSRRSYYLSLTICLLLVCITRRFEKWRGLWKKRVSKPARRGLGGPVRGRERGI